MIIWGTTGRDSPLGGGNFHCPRCATERSYTHKAVKRYFTLYFIPLIPMGSGGEYIECESCTETFATDMISYDPELERAKTVSSLRRLAVAFLLDINRCRAAELKTLQDVVGDFAGHDLDSAEIAHDVRQAQEANVDLIPFAKKETLDFSDDGKWTVLAIFRRILERRGEMLPMEHERIAEVGSAIGLRKKHVRAFMETPVDADA